MSSAPAAARTADVHDIWRLRRQLEDWIAAQGIDQWLPGEVPEAVIDEQVGQRQWYVLRQQAKLAAALGCSGLTRTCGTRLTASRSLCTG